MAETIAIRGVPHTYELTPKVNSNPTLVFVHGWLLSREYWQPVIQHLAVTYQCLSYDLRGFGNSPPPGHGNTTVRSLKTAASGQETATAVMVPSDLAQYTPAAYANDLIELLQTLNISNPWLIGHSLGGSIALWAADLAPELVSGVICVNSGGGIYLKEEFERFRAAGEQLVKLRPRWLLYLPLLDLMMTRMSVVQPLDRRWGRQRLRDWVTAQPEAALGALLESTTEEEVHLLPQLVARLKQPVHFIAGEKDMVMEPQYVRHLASFHHLFQHCGANVIEIANCGHLAMLEHPDRVTQIIQDITLGA